ncbi:MAG: hypothetical protein IPL43_15620 [Micropruina sp.]|nr:hypothetical protein [Micropruina sp.]
MRVLCGAMLAMALTGTGCSACVEMTKPSVVDRNAPAPVIGDGRDRRGSKSASDWATHAEYVVAFTVVGEVRGEMLEEERERQEGMISREVIVRVDRVLWESPDDKEIAPVEIRFQAVGWVFNNNNGVGERPFAMGNAPRLELGHSYVKALDWEDDPCSSDPHDGDWHGLGAWGTIPFDNGILGVGEIEGRVQDLRNYETQEPSFREQMAGQSLDTLARALNEAERRTSVPFDLSCDPEDQ